MTPKGFPLRRPLISTLALPFAATACLGLTAVACGAKTETVRSAPTAAAPVPLEESEIQARVEAALVEINAAVPEAYKDSLRFILNPEWQEEGFVNFVPEGWELEEGQSTMRPTDDDPNFEFPDEISGTRQCGGACVKRADWPGYIMEWVVPNFLRQSENAHEVEEKTAHSIFIRHRLNNEFNLGAEEIRMIATQSDPNAKYFGDCRVVLSGDSMAAAPAFELACRKSFVTRWER